MKAYVEVFGFRFPVAPRVGWVIFAAALSMMASALFLGAHAAGKDSRLLAAEGVTISATVVEKHIEDHRRRSGSGARRHSKSYHLRLAYSPSGLARVEVQESVSRRRYDVTEVGDLMTIRYAPSQPRVFEVEPGDAAGAARTQWWLAFGSALGALGSAVWAWRQWGQPIPET